MKKLGRAGLAALIGVYLGFSTGCVDGHAFSAVDVPEHLVEFPPARWEPIALTALTVYRFGVAPAPTGWHLEPEYRRNVPPIPANLNFIGHRATDALSSPATPLGEDLPAASWHVRLILSTWGGTNMGFCLIFPCLLVDQINFELRVLAIPLGPGSQAYRSSREVVWICEPESFPPVLRCQGPNPNLQLRSTVLPEGTRSFVYHRRVYRRGTWTVPWHRMWRDEVIGSPGAYEAAYQRVVDDMLGELTADLSKAGVLISAKKPRDPAGPAGGADDELSIGHPQEKLR